MAIGRISGPLLAQNLFRDNVPLSFYNVSSLSESPLLHLDVTNGKIGIKTSAPSYELDVAGYVNAQNLRVVETAPGSGISTLGRIVIYSGTITTVVGPIDIEPSGNDDINLRANVTVFGDLHATGSITADGDIQIGNTSTDTVVFDAEIRSDLIPEKDNTYNLGSADASWAEGYFNKLYTNFISSNTGSVKINPGSGLTEITGDIRVTGGTKPLGTAPIVTNILYVTTDGDDVNDGRAQDASRACRTISGAVKSPYYGPGTSIKVAPGQYLENNPIPLQPYTSVIGSDLRTTVIEPINKTQDLFHLQSGCYLAQMQFLNGRSGLLPIDARIGFNRGAYCTAFKQSIDGSKIDIYHSPYIQNCTNQSGPWLIDGTMFVPNQTIQIPTAVATSSWDANTSTLIITVTNGGTISENDSVNEGPQHTGFFDARTLALANKGFLQEQVVAYVDNTFNTSSFVYDSVKCSRDTALIINAIANDLMQDSDSDSTFAGLQYWSQIGYVSGIVSEITTTTAAINHIKYAIANAILDAGDYGFQVRTTNGLFDSITGILNNGTTNITTGITSNGLASTNSDIVASHTAIVNAKSSIITNTINWIGATYPSFVYNTSTCARDMGYIIDAVAYDLLHGGNIQSIKTGVYYYTYGATTTEIPNEIPQTTEAFNFIRSIIPSIIKSIVITTPYQRVVTQVTNANIATDFEVSKLTNKIDIITSIIRNGPNNLLPSGYAPVKTPINTVTNSSITVLNARNLLAANINYIQAEVIAYINSITTTAFKYSREKCARDVGILIENIAYDVTFGGNQKAVESGLAYYNGTVSVITNQESQTVSAIDYLSELTKQVITNTTVTNLYSGGTQSQVINTVLTGGTVAVTSYENSFNIITSIINSGPSAAPAIVTSSGPDSQLLSAEVLLQTNRSFIQDNIIEYIDAKYNTLTYNQDKCFRDTGLIVDAIALDLLFTTSSQSTFAGVQYWNQSSSVIPSETTATVTTFAFVRDLVKQIVVNDTSGVRYSGSTQDTTLPAATDAEASVLNSEFNLIIDIIQNGTAGITDRIIPNSVNTAINIDVRQAYALIQANNSYIKNEAVAFINATLNPGSIPNYTEAKCKRDIGYILDSVSFDLLYGGNKQAIQSGVSYFGYSNTTAIPNETTATNAAYNFIKTRLNDVITGTPVSVAYQDTYTQIINGAVGTAQERIAAGSSIDKITSIITNGPSGVVLTPISLTASTSTNVINAANILLANKKFIQAETVAFINQYYSFTYNKDKCHRDTGLIIDAVVYDTILGGNSKSIEAGLGYFIGTTSAKNSSGVISQVTNLPAGSVTEVNGIYSNIDLITNIINNGPSVVTSKIPINLTTNVSTTVTNAYNLLIANREFIQAEVIGYIDETQNALNYSKDKCKRDTGLIVDSLALDLIQDSTSESIFAGLQYWTQNSYVGQIASEITTTTAAINYVKSRAISIATGAGGSTTAATVSAGFDIILNILNNGVAGITDTIVSNGLPTTDTSVVSTYNALLAAKTTIINDTITFISTNYPSFTYNVSTCQRDVGYIIDSVSFDLLHGGNKQSVKSGVYYYGYNASVTEIPNEIPQTTAAYNFIKSIIANIITGQRLTTTYQLGYSSDVKSVIKGEITQTVDAVNKIKDLALSIIANLPVQSLTPPVIAQVLDLPAGSNNEISKTFSNIDLITNIINNGPSVVTSKTPINLITSVSTTVTNAYNLIIANRAFIQAEVIGYIDQTQGAFNYSRTKCKRDTGLIVDSLALDLIQNSTSESTFAGLQYWTKNSYVGQISSEITTTTAAINYVKSLAISIANGAGGVGTVAKVTAGFNTILNILNNGVAGVTDTIISNGLASTDANIVSTYNALIAAKSSLETQTVAFISSNYPSFTYNITTCKRDVGYIVDSVAFDLLHGGNKQSVKSGVYYYGYNTEVTEIPNEIPQTTAAYNFIKSIIANIIIAQPLTTTYQYSATQQILPFYQGGAAATEAIQRNIEIITSIMMNGPSAAPAKFTGTALYAKTGVNPSDTKLAYKVTNPVNLGNNKWRVTLKNPVSGTTGFTVGAGFNATLYFGKASIFPLPDSSVEALSLQYTGKSTSWNSRKVDALGAMGGSLVDGADVSSISPVNSFVYDAFTQVAQGGKGIHITNNGYAQLVSVFTIFCSTAVQVDNGGIASITNSNSNFGDICLLAKGYGTREFSGTVYNPSYQSDPYNPELNQYYPEGFYPNDATVKIFVPDSTYRPHIGLVMEVEPRPDYINDQGFPGFLTAATSVSYLTTSSLTITDIDTSGIAIGNTVYIRDIDVREVDGNGIRYAATGTTVVDIAYNTVYLNQALTSGGGSPITSNNFDIYFCGNAYYTVLSSVLSDSTSSNALTYGTRIIPNTQVTAEIAVLDYINTLIPSVITNTIVSSPLSNALQVIDFSQNIGVSGETAQFISASIAIIKDVLTLGSSSLFVTTGLKKSGVVPNGSVATIALLKANFDFLANEALAYINLNYPLLTYDIVKCSRDIKLILQQIIYDIGTGGNYNSVYSGYSYWARPGTYHIVSLEDQVRDPALFQDGITVNFYQRSYMSALGYTLEYVGAGITYGALPQVGLADPVQSKETVQLNNGKVFFTSTDQNGDFRIGPELVISQATGTLRGRTFSKSLFAEMTPFILAVESGGA